MLVALMVLAFCSHGGEKGKWENHDYKEVTYRRNPEVGRGEGG